MDSSTLNAWFAGLRRQLTERQIDVVPDGWLTASQIGEKLGLRRQNVERTMGAGARLGKVKMQEFTIIAGDGKARKTKHYYFRPEPRRG